MSVLKMVEYFCYQFVFNGPIFFQNYFRLCKVEVMIVIVIIIIVIVISIIVILLV